MLGFGPISSAPISSLPDELYKYFPIPPEESEAAYFEPFGRFIASYSLAESGVHEVARSLSTLSEKKARVIFAGMRLGDLADRIRAMLRADAADAAKTSEIDACLGQADKVQDARNKLVHRAISFQMGR